MKTCWQIGQEWITPQDVIYVVVYIRKDGMAGLQMISPYKIEKVFTQLEIPKTWKLKSKS